jgi:arylsulfatase A-like enzyme
VFLLGDHGWSLGEHGLWAKHSPFDHATKTPLIVRLPSQKENPAATGAAHGLVEFVDIFPTILELTKQPKLDQLQGSSFVAQIRDPKAPGKTAVFPRYQLAEVIKTEDYALTEWYGKQGKMLARMLYDHRVDPEETHNVAEEPEYSDVVEDLHNQLVAMMESR